MREDQSDVQRPQLLSIVNITPDSFTPGTPYYMRGIPPVDVVIRMVRDGANIVDLGAEAMCPGSKRISVGEERERLSQVLDGLIAARHRDDLDFRVSIDTRNSETAEWALDHGADIINDVSALDESGMVNLAVRNQKVLFIFMHNLGTPPEKGVTVPLDRDVVEVVLQWGREKIRVLLDAGVKQNQLIFDPGIAFGKTAGQSLELIHRAAELHDLGIPLCFGHSRKMYVVPSRDLPVAVRDDYTAGFSHHLARQGVQYLRVHDVRKNKEAIDGDGPNLLADGWYEDFKGGLTRERTIHSTV